MTVFGPLRVFLQQALQGSNSTTDGDDRRKFSRVILRHHPSAVATHGKSSEIGALGIALEFFGGGGESGERHSLHGGIGPPDVGLALRHNDDGGETRTFF